MIQSGLLFFLNSSILLALFSFVFTFGLHSNWEDKWSYSSAIFLSVLGIYNFHRLYKFRKNQLNFPLSQWLAKNLRIIQLLSLVGMLSSSILFFFLLKFKRPYNPRALRFEQPLIPSLDLKSFTLYNS